MDHPPPRARPRRPAPIIRISSRQAERGIRRLLDDLAQLDAPSRASGPPGRVGPSRSVGSGPADPEPGGVDGAEGPAAAVVDLDSYRRARPAQPPVPPGEAV